MENKYSNTNRLNVTYIASLADYLLHVNLSSQIGLTRSQFIKYLSQSQFDFSIPGVCFVCNKKTNFNVKIPLVKNPSPKKIPINWREQVVCPICSLNNRSRASLHIFEQECMPSESAAIYITEQTTRLYRHIKARYPNTIGSEFLNAATPFGTLNPNGIRNENICDLTFESNSFDFILSFDVFEHVPNYQKGFEELYRCLKPGGVMLFSVPFISKNDTTLIRAKQDSDGNITHFLPPEYHGDPINQTGCLCFYHFGWDILKDLKSCLFEKADALVYFSNHYGYLGNSDQILFLARKSQ